MNTLDEKLSSGIVSQLNDRNPEHPFLKAFKNDEEFLEIKELWDDGDHEEAARKFRAKLTRISNSKLGTSLLLMIAGASLTSAGVNALNPPKVTPPIPQPPAPPKSDMYTVKEGDSFWKIAERILGDNAKNSEINKYMYQLARDNGLKTRLIDGVLTKIPKDPDLLRIGGKLVITPFIK